MLKSESWRRCGPRDTEGGETDRSASSPKGQRPTRTVCVRVGNPTGLSLRPLVPAVPDLPWARRGCGSASARCPGMLAAEYAQMQD